MQYQALNPQMGAPIDNGDGTLKFNVTYTVGIVGEQYGFVVQEKCTVVIPSTKTM